MGMRGFHSIAGYAPAILNALIEGDPNDNADKTDKRDKLTPFSTFYERRLGLGPTNSAFVLHLVGPRPKLPVDKLVEHRVKLSF